MSATRAIFMAKKQSKKIKNCHEDGNLVVF